MKPMIIMFSPSEDGSYKIYKNGDKYSLVYTRGVRPYEESDPILVEVTFEECMKKIGNIIQKMEANK